MRLCARQNRIYYYYACMVGFLNVWQVCRSVGPLGKRGTVVCVCAAGYNMKLQ